MAAKFELASTFEPAGDQPHAIAKLIAGYRDGQPWQTLLGFDYAYGSHPQLYRRPCRSANW